MSDAGSPSPSAPASIPSARTSIFNRGPGTHTPLPSGSIFSRNRGSGSGSGTNTPRAATPAVRDQPAEEEAEVEHKPGTIAIVVRDQGTSGELNFRMRKDRPLKKLMDATCAHFGKSFRECRFMMDGQRIKPDNTPDSLDMEEDDIIEVFTEQVGGCI